MAERRTEEVRTIAGESEDLTSYRYYWEGSDDYSKDVMVIAEIVNRDGQRVEPHWGEGWTTVADGILTRAVAGAQQLRIFATACPVQVRVSSWHEYVSWSDRECCSSSSSQVVVTYVASSSEKGAIVGPVAAGEVDEVSREPRVAQARRGRLLSVGDAVRRVLGWRPRPKT